MLTSPWKLSLRKWFSFIKSATKLLYSTSCSSLMHFAGRSGSGRLPFPPRESTCRELYERRRWRRQDRQQQQKIYMTSITQFGTFLLPQYFDRMACNGMFLRAWKSQLYQLLPSTVHPYCCCCCCLFCFVFDLILGWVLFFVAIHSARRSNRISLRIILGLYSLRWLLIWIKLIFLRALHCHFSVDRTSLPLY